MMEGKMTTPDKGTFETIDQPPNLEISIGGKNGILISQNVQRTLKNRFKYWMLCKFFPFKIERWEEFPFVESVPPPIYQAAESMWDD